MKAVIKNVGEKAKIVDIENELFTLQKIVEGDIEYFPLPNEMVLVCNETGKMDKLPLNFILEVNDYTDPIVGNVIFMGDNEDHTDCIDLSDEQIEVLHSVGLFSIK